MKGSTIIKLYFSAYFTTEWRFFSFSVYPSSSLLNSHLYFHLLFSGLQCLHQYLIFSWYTCGVPVNVCIHRIIHCLNWLVLLVVVSSLLGFLVFLSYKGCNLICWRTWKKIVGCPVTEFWERYGVVCVLLLFSLC